MPASGPNTLASTVEPDDGPVEPTAISRRLRSASVLSSLFQKAQVEISELRLPSHWNVRGSNRVLPGSINDSVVLTGLIIPMTEPSFGAAAARYAVALSEPAPGMCWMTIVGLLGIWRPRCRVSVRR